MAGGRAGAVAVAAVLLAFWDAVIELRRRPRRWHNLAPATSIRRLLQHKRRIDDLTGHPTTDYQAGTSPGNNHRGWIGGKRPNREDCVGLQ